MKSKSKLLSFAEAYEIWNVMSSLELNRAFGAGLVISLIVTAFITESGSVLRVMIWLGL
jgi:hypothetical protein